MIDYNDALDQLFAYFSKEEFASMVSEGKQEFTEFAGPFDEERYDIEAKWIQFRDWFLFQFKFNDKTPLDHIAENSLLSKFEIDPKVFESIQSSHLGLFSFTKIYKEQIIVKDLFSKEKIYANDSLFKLVLNKEDCFQTRIFDMDKEKSFGSSYVIHPPEARKYIDQKIKIVQKIKEPYEQNLKKHEILEAFFKMHYRAQRFRQVEISKVYSDQPLFEKKSPNSESGQNL